MPSGSKQRGEAEDPSLAHGEADSATMLCDLRVVLCVCVLRVLRGALLLWILNVQGFPIDM